MQQWKNFENRSIIVEVMGEGAHHPFLTHSVVCTLTDCVIKCSLSGVNYVKTEAYLGAGVFGDDLLWVVRRKFFAVRWKKTTVLGYWFCVQNALKLAYEHYSNCKNFLGVLPSDSQPPSRVNLAPALITVVCTIAMCFGLNLAFGFQFNVSLLSSNWTFPSIDTCREIAIHITKKCIGPIQDPRNSVCNWTIEL